MDFKYCNFVSNIINFFALCKTSCKELSFVGSCDVRISILETRYVNSKYARSWNHDYQATDRCGHDTLRFSHYVVAEVGDKVGAAEKNERKNLEYLGVVKERGREEGGWLDGGEWSGKFAPIKEHSSLAKFIITEWNERIERKHGDPGSRKQSVCNYIRFPREWGFPVAISASERRRRLRDYS